MFSPLYERLRYKKTIKLPLAKPEYANNQRLSDDEFIKRIEDDLISRSVNCEGFTEEEIQCYVNLHFNFCCGDLYADSTISIKDMAYLFDEKIKSEDPSMYNKMRRAYGFPGEKKYSSAKYDKVCREIIAFINQRHTVANALLYSIRFKNLIENIASKKLDSNGKKLSTLEYAQWAILWFMFFNNKDHFIFDYYNDGELKTDAELAKGEGRYFFPETMVLTEKLFASLEDNSISISEMKIAIDSCKSILRDEIYSFVQLGDDSPSTTLMNLGHLREIKHMLYETSATASAAANEPCVIEVQQDNTVKTNTAKVEAEPEINVDELKEQWKASKNVDFIKWWANHTDHKVNGKDFFENGMNLIYFTTEEYCKIVSKILEATESADLAFYTKVSNGEANDSIIFAILDQSDSKVFELIHQYVEKIEITTDDIFETLGVSLADFNFKKNFYGFNSGSFPKKISAAMKKATPSPRERTLLRIYNYLKTYDPICGNKKQKFSAYGINL